VRVSRPHDLSNQTPNTRYGRRLLCRECSALCIGILSCRFEHAADESSSRRDAGGKATEEHSRRRGARCRCSRKHQTASAIAGGNPQVRPAPGDRTSRQDRHQAADAPIAVAAGRSSGSGGATLLFGRSDRPILREEILEALVSGRSMLHGRNSRMPPTDGCLAESSYLERREIGPRECSKFLAPALSDRSSRTARGCRWLHSWSVSVAEVLSDETRCAGGGERRFGTGARRHPVNVSDDGVSSLIARIHIPGPPPGKGKNRHRLSVRSSEISLRQPGPDAPARCPSSSVQSRQATASAGDACDSPAS